MVQGKVRQVTHVTGASAEDAIQKHLQPQTDAFPILPDD